MSEACLTCITPGSAGRAVWVGSEKERVACRPSEKHSANEKKKMSAASLLAALATNAQARPTGTPCPDPRCYSSSRIGFADVRLHLVLVAELGLLAVLVAVAAAISVAAPISIAVALAISIAVAILLSP